MTHNLFGDRFLGARQPAWHGLGNVFMDPISATEAVTKANMDYKVVKTPLTSVFNNVVVDSGKVGIWREPTTDDPTYRYFGIASAEYNILQNMEVAEVINPLTDTWAVETIGAIDQGKTFFMTLYAGEAEIHGERVKQFFLITDTRDGGTSLKIAFTPVRVVCQNTLVSGLKQASISSAVTHDQNFGGVLTARVNLLGRMQDALTQTMASFEALANAAITLGDARDIFASAYPLPPRAKKSMLLDEFDAITGPDMLGVLYDEASKSNETWNYYCNRAEGFQQGAMDCYTRLCDEYPGIAGTAWGAYNAVVEFADFREGSESVPQSALFGTRAGEKKRAFAMASTKIR